jgi:hypothetical protein
LSNRAAAPREAKPDDSSNKSVGSSTPHELHMLQTTKCTDAFGCCDCSRPGAERGRYELLSKKDGKRGDCIVRSFGLLDLFLYILEHMYVVTAALVSTYVQV